MKFADDLAAMYLFPRHLEDDDPEYSCWVRDGGVIKSLDLMIEAVKVIQNKYDSLHTVAYQLDRSRAWNAKRPRGTPAVRVRYSRTASP